MRLSPDRDPFKDPPTIAPFPADIDRDYFGAWLSGFTDGEGCFSLYTDGRSRVPRAMFIISLRKDDAGVLRLIQSYLGRGAFQLGNENRQKSRPMAKFVVTGIRDIVEVIVPHFERFPLLAKKRADFVLFKQGVEIIASVNLRVRKPYHSPEGKLLGFTRKWTDEDKQQFYSVQEALTKQREYTAQSP